MHPSSKAIENAGWLIFAACSAGLCLILSSAHAATYYVSPRGDDSSAGTSEKSPWKTVAKVKAAALQPGDQVLFARGGEWREQLSANMSGASGRPIVYDAYGSGAKPKFWGSEVLPSGNWKALGGNVYAYPLSAAKVTAVLADHGVAPTGQWFNSGNPEIEPAKFDFKNGTLRINSATDPRNDGRAYTAVVREDVIQSNGKDHLAFRNLAGDETANPEAGYVIRVEGSDDVTLESCDALRGGRHLVGVINSTGFTGMNLYAAYALPHNQVLGCTFYVSYSGAESKFSNTTSKYVNCRAEHFEDGDGGAYLYFVCHGPKLGPISFVNPTDIGGKFSFLQDNPAQTVSIKGGLIRDAYLELFASNSLVDGVTFTGNASIDIWSNNNTIQNCLMQIKPIGGGPTGYGTAILTRSGANGKNNTIRFNTIVMDPTASPDKTCLYFGSSGQMNSWYGNILLSNGASVTVNCGKPGAGDACQSDYNFYGTNATFHPGNLSLAQWKALGIADQHALSGDPKFADRAAQDFELRAGSPALDAAKLDVTLFREVPTDFNGNPRLQGNAFDMGAFEGAVVPVKQAGGSRP